ncbi:LexA family protein [Vibrio fluvialis]|uniref:LexA family protein n=1 Tax=Vibrio fluvialis TaxID=676 RepID=UPI0005C9A67D|nr:S24 family peptidase [Vibrio fluvialis]EKO3398608.1 helix-turn-helix domain-containing protein [Vibrio fluvialis]EKO3401957.1 helix-turn-helix domain-containing protein [Vibrio fluvialis]EKO3952079.1 helix-turn-helix domain-containing protein [Vibrio fluvialis]EKO4000817.1 helix-turn-helix domain-containing protein [Vibrio fluvialis]EKO4005493.1 helix-turn-helix domain-containing protein [Vibrio fluvialis]
MKMNWNDLVKARMKDTGITQAMLAESLDKSQSAIAHWLGGNRKPSIEEIAAMMKIVGLSHMTLNSEGLVEYPDEAWSNVTKVDIQPTYQKSFPVLSSVQAGAWTEACEPYTIAEISEWYETTERTSERCFWLRVEGDSMTSGVGVSFPEGTLVLVDSERDHQNGSLVVAKLTDVNEATFKKLVIDAGQKYLKPLNTAYQPIAVNGNCKIIGVVVDAKLKLF